MMSTTGRVEAHRTPTYHPQFSSPDADVILVSSDDTSYRAPSFTLRNTCGFFRTLFAQNPALLHPQTHNHSSQPFSSTTDSVNDGDKLVTAPTVDVYEKDKVLSKVLSMVCGLYTDSWESIDEVEDVLALIRKWDAPGPLSVIRCSITAPLFLAEPLRLYAIATNSGWEEEAQLASTHTLILDIYHETYKSDLERISAKHLMRLLRLHRTRRDEFKRAIDGDVAFEAGNSSQYFCTRCGEILSNHTWRELKHRMVIEMDRRPLGDTICSLDMEEWAEAIACWGAKCPKSGCGTKNYNKVATMKDIRNCVERLPTHV